MTRCRFAEFCKRYKIDFVIFDLRSKMILLWSLEEKNLGLCIHKNHYCVIWKRNTK